MAKSYKKSVVITEKTQIGEGIFSMWVKDEEITAEAKPGQFLSLYCKSGDRLLPRPISICEIDKIKGELRLVYRVAGQGTKEISGFQAGNRIEVMGPLGNGFPLKGKKVILIGGGIGIPPMLELAKQIPGEKSIVLGYRDTTFLQDEFKPYGKVYIATEDGSQGTKGNVLDALRENGLEGEILYACGPTPMLKGIQAYGREMGIETYLSLEERMACGIGACLACVCKTKEKDHHTNVNNTRICKEGPVFLGDDIEL